MKIKLLFSKKADAMGRCEIIMLIRRKLDGKVIDIRAKSGIFMRPDTYDSKTNTVRKFSAKKLQTPEVREHNEQADRLARLLAHIESAITQTDSSQIAGPWLAELVGQYNNPDGYAKGQGRDIYALFVQYLAKKNFSEDFHKGNLVMIRSVYRYEAFRNATGRRPFRFDIDSLNRDDIEDYHDFIANEKALSEEYPHIFAQAVNGYPGIIGQGSRTISERGGNAVYKLMKKLKQFFAYLNREGITSNNPFEGVSIGSEKFGTPFYITSEERDRIALTPMPTKHLSTQRDIFVFHCLVGCRVSDLVKLTEGNITDGVLAYTPHKTQEEGLQALQARIPLHDKAQALVDRYRGTDAKGRLFPFISNQKYNDAIKEVFTIAGITRKVEVRNALTGEIEQRPINEVASSHLARRTFCGNLYFKVQDPNLIGKMSGHTEGSRAFSRYRKIEDETLKDAIDLL